MKKLYLLFTMAALLFTVSANAAVESMADLFGKYKFTATVNVTDAGQSYTEHFKSECDVTIAKCSMGIYDGEIVGLAGAEGAPQSISGFDLTAKTIKIGNPNGGGNTPVWSGGVYMSNAEGVYPFAGNFNDILYTFDPETKTITLPDFTMVSVNHGAMTAIVLATFTNAKLTLVESESIDVTDLSGDWHFTAGKGTYDVMENSTLPTEWDMTLTAKDDSKKNYDISLKLGEFAPLALTAKFDGVTLTIPFDETSYFDFENKIGIVNMYGVARPGEITFNMVNENQLSLTSGMTIAQDSISPEVPGGYMQWYMSGSAKKDGADAPAFTWPGTYTLKSGSFNVFDGGSDFAAESELVVEYNAEWGIYLVTKFLGYDVVSINYGGIDFEPSATDPNVAHIKLQSAYGGSMYVKSAEGVFYKLVDANGGTESLELKSNGDGTFSLSPFFVVKGEYGKESDYVAGFDQNVLTKQEETKPIEWPGTYTLKSDNFQVFDGGSDFAAESEMTIEYNAEWGIYLVTKFLGYDVVNINYGGIDFEPSATDPNVAHIKLQSAYGGSMYVKSAEGVFYKLVDANGGTESLELKSNGDGTFSLSPFFVVKGEYGKESDYVAGFDQNVLTKQEETKPIEWPGTYTLKSDNFQVFDGGSDFAAESEMTIEYNAEWGIYLVTKFLGYDVVNINYGGIDFEPSATDPLASSILLQSAYGGSMYIKSVEGVFYKLVDEQGGATALELKSNGDGTFSLSPFFVVKGEYGKETTYVAGFSQNVVTKGTSTDITAVETNDNIQVVNGEVVLSEAQPVVVYDFGGRVVFEGTTSHINGLANGMYVVKTPSAVMKVVIK